MRRRTALLIAVVVVVVVVAVIALWPRQNRARQLAQQAASPDQVRLWQRVADQGTPPGLERLPVPRAPVEPRQLPLTPSSKQVVTPGRGSLAPGVVNGVRVVSSNLPLTSPPFAGSARVADVSGDRIELDIGAGRLVFVARVGGMPLTVAPGSAVQLAFESRPEAFNRREILAVQTDTGALVASALETGDQRITLNVGPPLNLTAQQDPVQPPVNGSLSVRVSIGKAEAVLKPADAPAFLEGVWVRLLGSVALPASGGADASPYAIDLVAWREQGK